MLAALQVLQLPKLRRPAAPWGPAPQNFWATRAGGEVSQDSRQKPSLWQCEDIRPGKLQ